jgi:hypothetical protein
MRVPLSAIERVAFGNDSQPAPNLLRVLLSTVLTTTATAPVCIVLPSVQGTCSAVGILAAIECLTNDLPQTRAAFVRSLHPGMRVRLYPNGEVFEVAGFMEEANGLRLRLTDKKNYETNGTRFVLRGNGRQSGTPLKATARSSQSVSKQRPML